MAEFPEYNPTIEDLGFSLKIFSQGEDTESNLQEETTQINPNGVDAQVSRSIVSAVPGSFSASGEAKKKTDSSSSSSSRNGEDEDRHVDYEPQNEEDSVGSLVTQPPYHYDSDMFQVMMPPGENAGLGRHVSQPSHQNSRFNHIGRSYQATNPQQQLARTNRGSRSSTSHPNNFRRPFGMERQLSPNAAPQRPQNTYQQYPVVNQIPNGGPMQQTQMILPRPPFVDHNYAPWSPQNTNQQHPVANQIPSQFILQPNQMFVPGPPFVDHSYAPWMIPQNAYQQHPMGNQMANLVPMQQAQMNGPGPAFFYHNRAPWIPQNIYQQLPMANQMANLVPTQTMMPMRPPTIIPSHVHQQLSNFWATRPMRPRMYRNQHPMRMPRFRSEQTMTSPSGQPRASAVSRNYVNPRQPFVLPELNHQQMQHPTQSQGFDAGASSEQGQDQQQPSGQPRSVAESSAAAAASDSNAMANAVSGESSTNAAASDLDETANAVSGESSTNAATSDSNATANAVSGESSSNAATSDSNAPANAVSGESSTNAATSDSNAPANAVSRV